MHCYYFRLFFFDVELDLPAGAICAGIRGNAMTISWPIQPCLEAILDFPGKREWISHAKQDNF